MCQPLEKNYHWENVGMPHISAACTHDVHSNAPCTAVSHELRSFRRNIAAGLIRQTGVSMSTPAYLFISLMHGVSISIQQ